MNDMTALAKEIKRIRKQWGLTQQQLAKLTAKLRKYDFVTQYRLRKQISQLTASKLV